MPVTIDVDSVDQSAWTKVLGQFEDASIDQTWAFAPPVDAKNQISHLLFRRGDEVVACSQVLLRRIPALKLCVADVRWGPLFCRRGAAPNLELLPPIIQALKQEYAIKRSCLLRITPNVTRERKVEMQRILEAEGFRADLAERPYRTLMLDLSPSLEELRGNLLPRWRRHLNKAEKNNLVLVEGTSDELFGIFLTLAGEMQERKNLRFDYVRFRRIQQELPAAHKMNIIVCQHAGRPVAAVVGSAIGDTGIYLLGATGQEGLGVDASYLAHWRLIQWLKDNGTRYYDLGAINPTLNPGGYFFKQGISGKLGWDETFLHRYEGAFTARGRLASLLLKGRRMLQRER